MDIIGNNRNQTDKALFEAFSAAVSATVPVETKANLFDAIFQLFGSMLTELGMMRTENMAEIAAAFVTNGTIVQANGYDIITAMGDRTEVKTTGTKVNTMTKQGRWVKHRASVKISEAKSTADYFFITVSLNHDDGTCTPVMYLIPRHSVLTKAGTIRNQLDFKYGLNASVNTNDAWYPYMFRDISELAARYEQLPLTTKVDDLFSFDVAA